MHAATREVLALGHRRVLYIVRDTRLPTTRRRILGFEQAMAQQRGAHGSVLQRDPFDDAFGTQVERSLAAARPPTAIIASNSTIALSLVRILMAPRQAWPDDVSLLAFDEPLWASILSPPLAVVRHPTARIAQETWQRVLLRLREPQARPRRITLDAHFVSAASLAPPRR